MGGGGQVVVARLRLHNVRDQHVLAVPCDNIQIDLLMSGGFGFPFRFLHLRITSMLSMLVCPHLVQAKELDQRGLVQLTGPRICSTGPAPGAATRLSCSQSGALWCGCGTAGSMPETSR